jgi:Zn-dependent protease with chaperone function
MALASALQKIDGAAEPTVTIGRGIAHLCIADPLGRKLTDHEGFWGDVFATHPPIGSRIFALQQMAYLTANRPAGPPAARAGGAPRTPPPAKP